jgi:Uma2 family endonuclease
MDRSSSPPAKLFAPGPATSGHAAVCPGREPPFPPVDERIVQPESRFEVMHGQVYEMMGSHKPHAIATGRLAYILSALVRPEFDAAVDMLTRADRYSDVAPDACVFPKAPTLAGGRRLEHLVFEVLDSQSVANVTEKVRLLKKRGVRRLFILDINAATVSEWIQGRWNQLSKVIEDPTCFVRPLGIKALLEAADADREVALALLAKRTPVLMDRIRKGEIRGEIRGEIKGEIRGEIRGEIKGEMKGLRATVASLCKVLDIELSLERRTLVENADETTLRALVDHIQTHRQWLGGDMPS